MRRMFTLVLVLAAVILAATPQALAQQQKCFEFRAIFQMSLRVDLVTNEGNWVVDSDGICGLLDGQKVTPTLELGPTTSTYHGKVGLDRGGTSVFAFNTNDSFTFGDWHAVYASSPGKAGMYNYQGLGKITGGTGIFQNATGSTTQSGPYILWVDPAEPTILRGKFNGAQIATVCVAK